MLSRVSFPNIEHILVVYCVEFAVKRKTPNFASSLGPWGQGYWRMCQARPCCHDSCSWAGAMRIVQLYKQVINYRCGEGCEECIPVAALRRPEIPKSRVPEGEPFKPSLEGARDGKGGCEFRTF